MKPNTDSTPTTVNADSTPTTVNAAHRNITLVTIAARQANKKDGEGDIFIAYHRSKVVMFFPNSWEGHGIKLSVGKEFAVELHESGNGRFLTATPVHSRTFQDAITEAHTEIRQRATKLIDLERALDMRARDFYRVAEERERELTSERQRLAKEEARVKQLKASNNITPDLVDEVDNQFDELMRAVDDLASANTRMEKDAATRRTDEAAGTVRSALSNLRAATPARV